MFLVPPPGLMKPKVPPGSPGPQHIESVSNSVSFLSGNLPLNLAVAPQAGDMLFIFSGQGGGFNNAIDNPSGFSTMINLEADLAGDGDFRVEVKFKVATGLEGTNFTLFRSSTGVGWAAGISVYRENAVSNPSLQGFILNQPVDNTQAFPEVLGLNPTDLSVLFMLANRSGASAVNITARPATYATAFEQAFSDSGPGSLGTTDRILAAYFTLGSSLPPQPFVPDAVFNASVQAHTVESRTFAL